MKLVIVGIVFACAVGVLLWQGVSSKVPVLQVHQVLAEDHGLSRIQVDGGKVLAIESLAPLRFVVAPEGDSTTALKVYSSEIVPENFKVGVAVSLRGQYDADAGTFNAYRVTTACPSKYRAAETAYSEEAQKAPGLGEAVSEPVSDAVPLP